MNSATGRMEVDTSQISTRLGLSFFFLYFISKGTPP